MPDVKEYFLVTGHELQQIKEAQRPFLNYPELYDSVNNSKEQEQEKLPIIEWKIFDWRLK